MSSSTGTAGTPAVRVVGGVEVPAPGTWVVDPGHAEVGFVGRHFGLTKVRGRFTGVDGVVRFDEDVARSVVQVSIDMASVSSGSDVRDDHLRSADLFDVAAFPTARFASTRVDVAGSSGTVTGDLTIRGVTRPVVLDVELLGVTRDPWGGDRAVLSASAAVDRRDWDLTWNMVLETGGLLVSNAIRLEIEVELVRQDG